MEKASSMFWLAKLCTEVRYFGLFFGKLSTYLRLYCRRVVVAHEEVADVVDKEFHGFFALSFRGKHLCASLPLPIVDGDGLHSNATVADKGG